MSGDGVVTVDPHVHTRASYDATASVRAVLERASAVGLNAVVVTDHDEIEASLRAAELAPEYGLVGIPGVEVSTDDGHLLAIGVDERPDPRRPFAETVETVRAAGGVAVVPHPFQRTRHGVRKSTIHDCDGIETLNACSLSSYRNREATRFARRRDYPQLAGSDAHDAALVGRAYTEVRLPNDPADPTREAVLDAVRRGRTAVRGRLASKRSYLRKYVRNARIRALSLL
ncbi:CehA/McbA family metallohydrolase [Halorussus halobius]|uniref:CehA/McbA family metallohydrolase n=1 Tax=Halorussus halobius TaxID=1710537 RepID=UPI001091B1C5|nr:PHP domain-containing protein [Halorussus halobius]